MRIVVIGGGAAGFFTAINIAEKHPEMRVTILEKTSRVLSKVRVSGGGRCNVTNARNKPGELVHFYPRGHKKLHSLFKTFSTNDMVEWLQSHGVSTKSEPDLRMFPVTDSSQTIIDCFTDLADNHGVEVKKNTAMNNLSQKEGRWLVQTNQEDIEADKVIITTGASPLLWSQMEALGLEITPPVPSLFTFNISDSRIKNLQGVSFAHALVKITGTKLEDHGPLLITHWGMSGPAVLKLSAWGARELNKADYKFSILVNFTGNKKSEEIQGHLMKYKGANPKRTISKYPLFDLSKRFWESLTSYCGIGNKLIFSELSKKHINKLTEELTQGLYEVAGKSTFKEEFVTSGGVKLSEIDLTTFESRKFKNLYLAGEVLDIDALTGGFNFQACWSAGWVISEAINRQ